MNTNTALTLSDSLNRLYKSHIGGDNFFNLSFENGTYPPYNIEKISDDNYKLTLAIAGFKKDNIDIVVENNYLTISGNQAKESEPRAFIHQGIAERDFQHKFKLLDNTIITSADFNDGLLNIVIKREIPEKLKPRRIPIE